MTAAHDPDPLRVAFPSARGAVGDYSWDFTALDAGSAFQRQAAAVWRARIDPVDGTWTRPTTPGNQFDLLRRFARHCAVQGTRLADINDITRDLWTGYLATMWHPSAATMLRAALLDSPDLHGDAWAALTPRLPKSPDRKPQRAMTPDDVLRLGKALWVTARAAHARIGGARRLLAAYRAGPTRLDAEQQIIGKALDHLETTGVPPGAVNRRRDVPTVQLPRNVAAALGGSGATSLYRLLFPQAHEMAAIVALLILVTGVNRDSLLELDTDHIHRADALDGDEAPTFVATVYKPRRDRDPYSQETWIDTGSGSPGEALRLLLEITTPIQEWLARTHDQHTTRAVLLLGQRRKGARFEDPPVRPVDLPRDSDLFRSYFAKWWEHPDTDPPPDLRWVTSRTLRRWFIARERAQGHSEPVHLDDYLLRDEQVRQESVDITERVLNDHITATLLQDDPPDRLPGEETVAASCADFDHSPFSDGGRCLVSFMTCLACPLATIAPMHLPRWILIRDHLQRASSVVDAALWEEAYVEHYHRVTDLLTPGRHYRAAALKRAAAAITDEDRAIVQQLVDREFDAA